MERKSQWSNVYKEVICINVAESREFFLNAWQFVKRLYMMVRQLLNRFIGKCSWYLGVFCVVNWFMNAFVHQNVKDFVQKIQNYAFTDLQIHLANARCEWALRVLSL